MKKNTNELSLYGSEVRELVCFVVINI